jgi:prevent-host-death family protein
MPGIREVKQSFSQYLNRVAYGRERLIIHSRGKPKAALVSMEDLRRLEAADAAAHTLVIEQWNGQPYAPGAPVAVNRGPRCVSDLLIEDREPEWWSYTFPEERA